MAGSRRYFGNVRRRESGRYQARYRAPDGKLRSAPYTFDRKAEAVRWLTLKEAEIRRGDWIDPEHAGVLFGNYAEQWLQDRVLKVRTADLYQSLLRNHLLPAFGAARLSGIDEAAVRRWRKERLDTGACSARPFGPVTVAKAYRLLHAIFETAVDDQMVRRNPCRIEGAGREDSPERDVVSLPVVFAIADALPVRYRAMLLLATFASLRWGELVGLRRVLYRPGRVHGAGCWVNGRNGPGGLLGASQIAGGSPGRAFPVSMVPEPRWHLERFAQPGERGLVFVGPRRGASPVQLPAVWKGACARAGLSGLLCTICATWAARWPRPPARA